MNDYEELASNIIDEVCDIVEMQHPEIRLNTKIAKEAEIDSPALICGGGYYSLEIHIASRLEEFFNKLKFKKYINKNE